MNNVAFVTYNTLGDDNRVATGWQTSRRCQERKALVLQNTKGRRSAADQWDRWSAGEVDAVRREIGDVWDELSRSLHLLDHVVVYVGASGSEAAVELASKLPAGKVTFVRCRCGLAEKDALIDSSGMQESQRITCECGGRATMRALFECFMDSGLLR